MVRAEPETYWVFGDNLERRGLGGQAKEMRGEPNAIGIVTKRRRLCVQWRSSRIPNFRWTSSRRQTRAAFVALRQILEIGGTVVFPQTASESGLADLERRAPRIWASLQRAICEA